MQFEVRITESYAGGGIALQFEGVKFECDSIGDVTIIIPSEHKHRLYAAVEAQQAWESGDHVTEYTKGAAA